MSEQALISILTVVFSILALAGTWALLALARVLKKRESAREFGSYLETSARSLVHHGISFAEQWARNVLKLQGRKPLGDEKLLAAVEWVQAELKESGAEEKSIEWIERNIESVLGERLAWSDPRNVDTLPEVSGR